MTISSCNDEVVANGISVLLSRYGLETDHNVILDTIACTPHAKDYLHDLGFRIDNEGVMHVSTINSDEQWILRKLQMVLPDLS